MQREGYSLHCDFMGPPPLKGPQAGEQRGSKDNTLRKMLFLLDCRGGRLARDQRHLPVARPSEVLISIFLRRSCGIVPSSPVIGPRDFLGSLSVRHTMRTYEIPRVVGFPGDCSIAPPSPHQSRSRRCAIHLLRTFETERSSIDAYQSRLLTL